MTHLARQSIEQTIEEKTFRVKAAQLTSYNVLLTFFWLCCCCCSKEMQFFENQKIYYQSSDAWVNASAWCRFPPTTWELLQNYGKNNKKIADKKLHKKKTVDLHQKNQKKSKKQVKCIGVCRQMTSLVGGENCNYITLFCGIPYRNPAPPNYKIKSALELVLDSEPLNSFGVRPVECFPSLPNLGVRDFHYLFAFWNQLSFLWELMTSHR